MKRAEVERILKDYTRRIIGAGMAQPTMGAAFEEEDFEGLIEEVLDDLPTRSGATNKVSDVIQFQRGGPPKPGAGGMALNVVSQPHPTRDLGFLVEESRRQRVRGW